MQACPSPSPLPLRSEEGRFVVGRRHTNTELTVNLPAGTTVCDIGTLTIWCRLARSFFTTIIIPPSTVVSWGLGVITHTGTVVTQYDHIWLVYDVSTVFVDSTACTLTANGSLALGIKGGMHAV